MSESNIRQVIAPLLKCIAAREISKHKKYAICWFGGELECRPLKRTHKDTFIFGVFTEDELRIGLTRRQWSDLTFKILTFLKREEK